MMPGMIHPLIWSINVPLINSVWLKILEELVGKLPIKPEDLAKSFFYRSYFNMGTMGKIFATFGFPSEGLEMMMGIVPKQEGRSIYRPTLRTLKHIPRLIKFIFDKWNFHRRIKTILPSVLTRLKEFSANPELDNSAETLLFEVERLKAVVSDIVYLNIVTPLLVSMFVRLLEQQLKTNNIDIVDIDLLVNLSEIDQYNPNVAIGKLKVLYDDLTPEEKATISPSNLPVGEFSSQFNQFILDFGHYSDNSNNFMAVPWRENPERVIDLIKNYEVKTETQEK